MKDAKLKLVMILIMMLLLITTVSFAMFTTNQNSPVDIWVNTNSVPFNFTVNDTNSSIAVFPWCVVYINNSGTFELKANYSDIPKDTPFTKGIAVNDSNAINHGWNLTCWNGTHFNSSIATFGVDGNIPSITLDSPNDNKYLDNNQTMLKYTPTDTSNPDDCLLYTNISGSWAINMTNLSFTSGTQIYMNMSGTANGVYMWNAWCNDTATNSAWAEPANRSFTVDTINPTFIDFTIPANNTVNETKTQYIAWNQTVEINFEKYELFISTDALMTNITETIEISSITSNFTTLTGSGMGIDGLYYLQVRAYDLAGRVINSTVLYLNIDSGEPTVELNAPLNNTYTSDTTPDFNVTVTDEFPDTCIVWLSDKFADNLTINNTFNIITSGTEFNMTSATGLSDGIYKFNIECNDTVGRRVNVSSTLLDLTIDTTSPATPNIMSQWGGSNNTDKTPYLEWQTSGDINFERYIAIARYVSNGTIDFQVNVSINSTNNAMMNLTSDHSYNFSVEAYDLANNFAESINTTTETVVYVDPVCGTLSAGWNLCGATWETPRNLSVIGSEMSATFVTVWNISNHAWATCNYASSATGANCHLLVGINDSVATGVYIYVNSSTEWRNRTWSATGSSLNITLTNNSNIGWNIEGGFFRNGRNFETLGNQFTEANVSMFSLPYNNGTSIPYVNMGLFAALNNATNFDFGRAMWIYYNGSITTATWDVGSW